jgi:transcriptional regulator with XRE-family HTH domain
MHARIKQLREAAGLTMEAFAAVLAERTGVEMSVSAINRLEKGQSELTVRRALDIATTFGVTLADVVDIPEIPNGLTEEVTPYVAQLAEAEANAAGPFTASNNRYYYLVKVPTLDAIGIAASDVVEVDISAGAVGSAQMGDAVIAQAYGAGDMTHAVTVLRQFIEPSLLITNSLIKNRPSLRVDSHTVIKGIVVARFEIRKAWMRPAQ